MILSYQLTKFHTLRFPDGVQLFLGLPIYPGLASGEGLVELCKLLVEFEYLRQGLVGLIQHHQPLPQHLHLRVLGLLKHEKFTRTLSTGRCEPSSPVEGKLAGSHWPRELDRRSPQSPPWDRT